MDRIIKGLLCAVLCAALLFAPPCLKRDVRAETAGEAATPPAPGEQLILVPLRNATLDVLDREGLILNEMMYSLELLRYDPVSVSVVPLLADKQDEPVDRVTLPEGMTKIKSLFAKMPVNRKLNTGDMKTAIGKTLDHVLELVNSGGHATVVFLQAQAIDPGLADHPQWQKLRELVDTGKADLVLLGVESTGMPDLTGFSQGLGLVEQPARESSLFTTLGDHVQAALIPAGRLESTYDLMAELFLGMTSRPKLTLSRQEGYSAVTLPGQCVSNLLLVLRDIPTEDTLLVTDGQGSPLTVFQEEKSIRSERLLQVESPGGEIRVMAVKGGTDTGNNADPATYEAVDGVAIFDFDCEASLQLLADSAQPLYKKQDIRISAELSGQELKEVLQTFPDAAIELIITDQAGTETAVPLAAGISDPMIFTADKTFEHAGTYLVKAQARLGDFYLLESGQESLVVNNHPPAGTDQKVILWTDDPFGQLTLAPYSLNALFADADGDTLRFGIAAAGGTDFGDGMTVPGLGRLSVAGSQLLIASTALSGHVALDVLASDEDGYQAKAGLELSLFSLYEEMGKIVLEAPVIGDASPGQAVHLVKGAETTVTVRPVYQGAADGTPLDVFLAHATVSCELRDTLDALAEPVVLPMLYDSQAGVYRCDLTMENRERHFDVAAVGALSLAGVSSVHEDLTYRSEAASIETSNTAPQWIPPSGEDQAQPGQEESGKNTMDLGAQKLTDSGTGKERYTLSLNLAERFKDDDNTVSGEGQDITYLLRATEKGRGECQWTLLEDGSYLVSPPAVSKQGASPADAVSELRLGKVSAITIVFETKGDYTLALAAVDPDGKQDQGSITLRLSSQWEEQLTVAAYIALGVLALLAVLLLVIRLLKPAFHQVALHVKVSAPAFSGEWTTQLDAWGKAKVQLRWVLINGGVPPVEELYAVAAATYIKPSGKGVRFLTAGKKNGWRRGRERLPGSFVQRVDDPSITFDREDGIRIDLTIRGTAGMRGMDWRENA